MSKPLAKPDFGGDFDLLYEQLIQVVKRALKAKRKVSVTFTCKKCRQVQIHQAEVEDVDAALKAARYITEYGLGKPREAKPEENKGDRVLSEVSTMSDEELASLALG